MASHDDNEFDGKSNSLSVMKEKTYKININHQVFINRLAIGLEGSFVTSNEFKIERY